ncbi:MAG: hypothetical protein IPJ88_13625 [Myxococcales bacterium]|nr:MAG: hypothetical protein IPJ88_13625 [Myxococcales bacterium]
MPLEAVAQDWLGSWNETPGWLDDRERSEGRGFRAGDLELHPGLGVEGGWDSNIYFSESSPVDSALLRVSPHLLVSTIGADRLEESGNKELPSIIFKGGVNGAFYHYFENNTRDNMSAGATMDLTLNPGRIFSVDFHERFLRSIRPFTQAINSASPYNFARDRNNVGVDAILSSRGGVLTGRLGYDFGFDYFEEQLFRFGTNLRHDIHGSMSWSFLPHTSIVYEASLDIQDYTDANSGAATTLLSDNQRFRTRLGLNGALTQRLSFSIFGGYSVGFYEVAEEFNSLIAQAELRYKLFENVKLTLGYDREYYSSFLGNFYRSDRGYFNVNTIVAGRLMLGLQADLAYLDYGQALAPDGSFVGDSPDRKDVRASGKLFAEYRVKDWWAFSGSLAYLGTFTDFRYVVDQGTTGTFLDPARFSKFEAWLGTRVFF